MIDFIKVRHQAIVITTRKDGGPHASPVTCGVDEEGRIVYLDDDLEDEDDDLVRDDLLIERSGQRASADEPELQFTDNLEDGHDARDRLSRRYESGGELSDEELRTLGYGQDKEKDMHPETSTDDKTADTSVKGSGASPEDVEDRRHPRQEELLDEGIEESFPASDPVSVKHIT